MKIKESPNKETSFDNIEYKTLKTILFSKDITYRDLAKKIGSSENSITLKINGKRSFWFHEVLRITTVLGYSHINEVFPEAYERMEKVLDKRNSVKRGTSIIL